MVMKTPASNPHNNDQHDPGFIKNTGDTMTGILKWTTTMILNAINGDVDVIEYDNVGNLFIRCFPTRVIAFSEKIVLMRTTTALAPAYYEGAMYYDTTLHKLRIGGAVGWETVTSV